MAKVLVVEDDLHLAECIKNWLTFEHYSVEVAVSGLDGLARLDVYEYDVIILDWSLPEVSGIEICRQFRARHGNTPILMLTGKKQIADKEVGFNAGVDDYLTKPFVLKELSLRIRALLARTGRTSSEHTLQVRNIVLKPSSFHVTKDGKEVHLLPKEFALLEFFMRHPQEVFSAEALLSRVWTADAEISAASVARCLSRLRKKVEDEDENPLICTVHGIGYKLMP